MRKRYTHIFFDLDNTLWDFKTNSVHAMHATFNNCGLSDGSVSFEDFFEVYSRHNHQLWEAYRNKNIKKKQLISQRFELTFNELGITGIDAEAMNNMYLDEMPKQNHLIDGAIELLNYLKAKGCKLFIITNGFREVQHQKIQNSGLQSYFDKVFISEEVQAPKPDPAIFEHAIKSANAKKASSLMIGDDWEVDIEGALNFGIDAIFFDPQMQPKKKKGHQHDLAKRVFIVHQLSQLNSVLNVKS